MSLKVGDQVYYDGSVPNWVIGLKGRVLIVTGVLPDGNITIQGWDAPLCPACDFKLIGAK